MTDCAVCDCGHPTGWHRRNVGSCIECACPMFLEAGSDEANERAWSYELAQMKEHDLDA